MRFAYARTGGPLLDWSGVTPPSPSRAGETRSLGALDLPRPGAPEVVAGYEAPQPGAAVIQLGSSYPWDQKYPGQTMSGYMPEGAARAYGQTMLADAAPAPSIDYGAYARRASVLAAAYHGAKRHNGSVLWGLLWGLAAYVAPLRGLSIVAIGVAQGFAQPTVRSNPAMGTARRRARKRMFARALRRKAKRRPASQRKTVRRRKHKRTTRYGTRRGY